MTQKREVAEQEIIRTVLCSVLSGDIIFTGDLRDDFNEIYEQIKAERLGLTE